MKYRVEDKYLIYEDQMAYIRTKLNNIMKPDPNMKDGLYLIRSLYFDDAYNSCMDENESGVDERRKYRIRAYDRDRSFVRLERKAKKNGFTCKESADIDAALTDKYINLGTFPGAVCGLDTEITDKTPGLLKELYAEQKVRLLSPVTIVEYERQALIDPIGNVRITFDRNIGYSTTLNRFWDEDINAYPILPAGQHILEIKYDELLPEYIRKALNTGSLQRSAFSKYYYSRTAEINMG